MCVCAICLLQTIVLAVKECFLCPQKAVYYIQKIIEINPDQPLAYLEHGKILLETGQVQHADGQFLKAHELGEGNALISGNIAKAYFDNRKFKKAIAYCRKALESNPDYVLVRLSLASTFIKTNQLKPAIEQYYQVLQRNSDNLEALNALAWIQATSKNNNFFSPKEALRLAMQANEILEKQGVSLSKKQGAEMPDTLAEAYASNSQFKKSIEIAEKAIKLAREQELEALAGRIESRRKLYQSGRHFRQ